MMSVIDRLIYADPYLKEDMKLLEYLLRIMTC